MTTTVNTDPWLDRWLPLITQQSPGQPVLELGCGSGRDTAELIAAGCQVIAADISLESLHHCAARGDRAVPVQLDLGAPLPFRSGRLAVIVASLSLHYFTWRLTRQIAAEVERCLRPGGLLLARVNSTKDVNHGAAAGDEIEPCFYRVDGAPKRFFDRQAVVDLLEGWDIELVEENVIHRYARPKVVWLAVARRRLP